MLDSYKDKGARKKLVNDLAAKGIVDQRVLAAMLKVPRHYFFNKTFQSHAYEDKAFPIGEGQTISQPYTVAYQTQLLHAEKGDKVLEIGTGSGYQAAILLELGVKLFTIERQPKLYEASRKLLTKLGYTYHAVLGDGTKGLTEHAPFDKIIVTAGAPVVPATLVNQLTIGGILVIPVGNATLQKMFTIIRKSATETETIELENFSFVPLIGSEGWRGA
jgi:protein-L-isoaspartate(D-aspartate) O-methyltransferase